MRLIIISMLMLCTAYMNAQTGTIEGIVMDGENNESLPGATVQIVGTTMGAATDFDGIYRMDRVPAGTYTLRYSYVSYESILVNNVVVRANEVVRINQTMKTSSIGLNEVVVTSRRNLESENMLLIQRQNSTLAVENMGAKEMSIKGISNVEDGVKKITGISVGGSQVFVRGLGDRYSITTLNGLSIASPNPDNKLIPLTLFPSSVVKNINVSKVYQASTFADYAGAHIDIESKENVGKDYFNLSLSTGGEVSTLGVAFYSSDKQGVPYLGFAKGLTLSENLKEWSGRPIEANAFKTNFMITQGAAIPDMSVGVGAGKSWTIGGNALNLALSANFSNDYFSQKGAHNSSYNNMGDLRNSRDFDEYIYETTTTGSMQLSYQIAKTHTLTYNLLYVNNTEDAYTDNYIRDYEGNNLWGSNSAYKSYTLINNQLLGNHKLAPRWKLDWKASLGTTSSFEPDRRQVMYTMDGNGNATSLFTLNQQETSRYYGELRENELVADVAATYYFNDNESKRDNIRFGAAYKNKNRDFYSANFYYNVRGIAPGLVIEDVYSPTFLNDENIANGKISVSKVSMPRDRYTAGMNIAGGFVDGEYFVSDRLLLSAGLRMEMSQQWVDYAKDAGVRKMAILDAIDPFAALNAKYDINKSNSLRFSASRTITRPSFIEMAPFAYRESYGGEESRGNEELQNGYNYNFDLRYEYFFSPGELISASLYYKHLQSPIEKIQKVSSDIFYSYLNAEAGEAMGVELELRKNIVKDLRFGFNASLMSTQVTLPEGGAYTSTQRQLQGASPYLVNADLNYAPSFGEDQQLSLSLVYNLRGPRIYAVGVLGLSDVIEKEYHTLDFVGSYSFNKKMQLKVQAKNLFNQEQRFTQEMVSTGETKVVKHYYKGLKFDVGFTYNF